MKDPSAKSGVAAPLLSMPVRRGEVVMKVGDFEAARQQVMDSAGRFDAVLQDARTEVNPKGAKHGWMRFQIPESRLNGMIPDVQGIGKLCAQRVTARDATSDYEDLARRAERLREHEQRLSSLLSSSRRLRGSDILFVQERLFRASVDESELLQQRVDLVRAARTSALTVTLFEPGALPPLEDRLIDLRHWSSAAFGRAHLSLNHDLARMGTAVAYLTVFAWLWIPLAVLAAVFERKTHAVRLLEEKLRASMEASGPREPAVPPAAP